MKKEKLEKCKKLVDAICSDESGANKPYDWFVKKWALEVYQLLLDEREETLKEVIKKLKI